MKKKKDNSEFQRSLKETVAASNLNLVSDGTTIKGSFVSNSDTRLGGNFEGELQVEGTVVVTEGGTIDGSIQAENITVIGAVQGQIRAEKKVILTSSANVEGTIHADRLVIEEGAVFNGECQMGTKSKTLSSNFVPISKKTDEQLAEDPI